MRDRPKIEDLAEKVLRELEWDSLRTRYQASDARLLPTSSYFHFDHLHPVFHDEEDWKWADSVAAQLNSEPRIRERRVDLRTFGIAADVITTGDVGYDYLVVIVHFDENGRKVLTDKIH